MRVILALAITALLLAVTPAIPPGYAAAQDHNKKTFNWNLWRGPNRNSISDETDWDTEFLKKPFKINWKINVGRGYSNVSIYEERLYTMGFDVKAGINSIYCLEVATGKEIWKYSYRTTASREWLDDHKLIMTRDYIGPKSTPVVFDGMVYTLGQNGDFMCNDSKTGKLVWSRQVMREFKAYPPSWMFASSALIEDGMAIVNAGRSGLALDRLSGKTVWQSEQGVANYSTPVSYTADGKARLAIFGQKELYGIDAGSGKVLWSYPWETVKDVNALDPVAWKDGILFICNEAGCALLDVSADSPVTLWSNMNLSSQLATPVILGNYIYGMKQAPGMDFPGTLACLDIRDGSILWTKGRFLLPSLIATRTHLLIIQENGRMSVTEATPDKNAGFLGNKKIIDRYCRTAPVLCRATLYIRNEKGDIISMDISKDRRFGLNNYFYLFKRAGASLKTALLGYFVKLREIIERILNYF